MDEAKLLERITVDPCIFGGKPIVRGRRLAVEHVLGMLAAGDSAETILEGYPWLEPADIQACLAFVLPSHVVSSGTSGLSCGQLSARSARHLCVGRGPDRF